MNYTAHQLAALYRSSQNLMRNIDGLHPQEAFDELLKYLFMKESADEAHHQFPPFHPPLLTQDIVSLNPDLTRDLRITFQVFLKEVNSWSAALWQDQEFHLSDAALLAIHELFENVDFCDIDIDTRSTALTEFVPGGLRRGLGIFPTPDGIARMMVEIASPNSLSSVFDPACGTGTFLVEVIRRWTSIGDSNTRHKIWGVDKNPRMLLLSELNLGHNGIVRYHRALADSLYQSPITLFEEPKEGFDCILTNPPFGVVLSQKSHDLTPFQTCRDQKGDIAKRQQSEVVFAEQCMKYLKPGGLLGIVLPRSVVTNSSLSIARQELNKLGYLESILSLPPETFCASGTQTNAVVLFVRRYSSDSEIREPTTVVSIEIDNVGFDSTGRPREGSQLPNVSKVLKAAARGHLTDKSVRLLPETPKGQSIANLPDLLSGRIAPRNEMETIPLKALIDFASNGKTPGRSNYSNTGLFLVKVGNLTGHGINWEPRDRNHIADIEETKRRQLNRLMLRQGDILLTSSAHSPTYIARKVDMVGEIPKWIGGEASFVGEIMMLRPKDDIDPLMLLAFLRLPSTQHQIQSLIRGQTAHLHPEDILEMQLPRTLLHPFGELIQLTEKIKEELKLYEELNRVAFEKRVHSLSVENVLWSSTNHGDLSQ